MGPFSDLSAEGFRGVTVALVLFTFYVFQPGVTLSYNHNITMIIIGTTGVLFTNTDSWMNFNPSMDV